MRYYDEIMYKNLTTSVYGKNLLVISSLILISGGLAILFFFFYCLSCVFIEDCVYSKKTSVSVVIVKSEIEATWKYGRKHIFCEFIFIVSYVWLNVLAVTAQVEPKHSFKFGMHKLDENDAWVPNWKSGRWGNHEIKFSCLDTVFVCAISYCDVSKHNNFWQTIKVLKRMCPGVHIHNGM